MRSLLLDSPFTSWWRCVNAELAGHGQRELLFGDAMYWWQRSLAPGYAAALIRQDRADVARVAA